MYINEKISFADIIGIQEANYYLVHKGINLFNEKELLVAILNKTVDV